MTVHVSQLYVFEDFERLLPPADESEVIELERSVKTDGFNGDQIRYWANPPDGKPTILDGHRRFRLWEKLSHLKNEPTTLPMMFASQEEAEDWIVRNQAARRNWTPAARDKWLAMLLKREQEKSRPAGRPSENTGKTSSENERQIDAHYSEGKAAERVAAQTGHSTSTVERAGAKEKASAAIRDADPKLAEQIESGEVKLSKADLAILGRMKSDEIRAAGKQIRLKQPWKPEKKTTPQKPRLSKPKEISPAKLVDALKKKYLSPLVKGIDAVAKVNGGQGPFYKAADAALDKFAVALKGLREGRQ